MIGIIRYFYHEKCKGFFRCMPNNPNIKSLYCRRCKEKKQPEEFKEITLEEFKKLREPIK